MRKLFALLAFLLWPTLSWGAGCTITGQVFNPDGTPLVNGTVQFNSIVQQTLQGNVTIPPTQISTTTDSTGTMKPISIVQGLQGQFVFCSPAQGGCGNPTPVLIPVASTANISAILIGIQLSSGGNVVASSLNVTGNSTMGGTLTVTGQTSLGALTASGATILQSTLAVTGAAGFSTITASGTSTLAGVTASSLNVSGASSLTTLGVTGATTLAGATATSLTVSGPGQFTSLGIGAAPVWSLDVQVNQNAATKAHVLNNSSGTGAASMLEADNGGCVTDVGVFGTGATPSGSPFYVANRNFLLGGCGPGLLIQASGPSSMLYLSAPNGNNVDVLGNNHFGISRNGVGPGPTVSACGTSPSVTGTSTDNAGIVTVGSSVSNCTITFAAGFPNIPACTCSTVNIGTWCVANPSTSGLSLTFGTAITGNASWVCMALL